jgi:DNA polymerase I-like protein with 3'-5' exonuclease and polymerase domains
MMYDTWHMAYVLRQATGTLGLEMIAYQWVPDMAGYEEDMTLLIELHRDTLHPEEGGHYAMCPADKWESHLKPYVMGDVEVTYEAKGQIEERLSQAQGFNMPLAHPDNRGRFRWFRPPSRQWVYNNVVSPANRMLIKIMGRGMYVDTTELARLEDLFPKKIRELRGQLRSVDQRVMEWCEQKEATEPGWELDLENKTQLKECLFNVLELPVKRLTEAGRRVFGEADNVLASLPREEAIKYAALDKYTLNMMSVDHPQVRPLQTYRKVFKEYSSYVRPMRNLFTEGLDKTHRKTVQHLARDGCVHASFLLTGTRGGRLSCKEPNLQQLPREGLIKRVYTSRFLDRGCIYQGDLSQIELRLLAAACGDEAMVDAYHRGIDLHSLTHSKIYRKPYEECTNEYMEWLQRNNRTSDAKKVKEERKVAKTVNFLTGYGGGAFGLQTSLASQGIYMSLDECENILESFFDAYPSLRRYLSYYKNFILNNGVAVSILGRVRIFEEVFGDNDEAKAKALRAGCNHLIQSTASDMMLVCLMVIEACMRNEGLESILVSTVHDSLVIDAMRHELGAVHGIVDEVLNNIPSVLKAVFGDHYDTSWCVVPFAGDSEVGLNMLDAKKISHNPDWDALLAA